MIPLNASFFLPWLLRSLTLVALASGPALAHTQSPYGPEVDRLQTLANQAEQRGDFTSAITHYQQSIAAARQLSHPVLRTCGIAGAESRVAGASAAQTYLQDRPRSAATLQAANARSQAAFEAYWRSFDTRHPDLVNSCP